MNLGSIKEKVKLLALCNRVRKEQNKGVLAQLFQIIWLRFGKGKLGAYEYYKYRLYDDKCLIPQNKNKEEFAGFRMECALDERLNHNSWRGMTTDKLIQYSIFKGLGVPIPEIYGVYHPSGRYFGTVPCVCTPRDLGNFLRNNISYPFFSKPSHGSFGSRAAAVRSYDKDTDQLEFLAGDKMILADYIDQCHPQEGVYPWQSGHIFQEYLTPHPEVMSICGPRLSSLRMIVLLADTGPRLFRAVWKIATGKNVVDNFQHGVTGNLLGLVDTETGIVKRVFRGVGIEQKEVDVNPDTGKPFHGFRIPQWDSFVEIGLTAATIFPGLRMQHWDIAISARGPIILEVNIGGDLDLPQLASNRGFLDAEFDEFLSQLGRTYPAYN